MSPDGKLLRVQPGPSIFEQFPLACHIVKHLYSGKVRKVAAFKAFLRSNQVSALESVRCTRVCGESIQRCFRAA